MKLFILYTLCTLCTLCTLLTSVNGTIILIYGRWPSYFPKMICQEGCIFTQDKKLPFKVVILWEMQILGWKYNLKTFLSDTKNKTRVLVHPESPVTGVNIRNIKQHFNLIVSYNVNSDVKWSWILPPSRLIPSFGGSSKIKVIEGKKGLIMWLTSHCNALSLRDKFVSNLMKYIKVDSWGRCLHNTHGSIPSDQTLQKIKEYKFYLALENSVCLDYVTEKFWQPLEVGTVPVYHGAPNVKQFSPSEKAAIFVSDFTSVRALADYILYLDRNNTAYEEYLNWRSKPLSESYLSLVDVFGKGTNSTKADQLCKLCNMNLTNNLQNKTITMRGCFKGIWPK